MRRHPDGSYWLPKQNASQEKQLDKEMQREGTDLRWFPKNTGFKLPRFKDQFKEQKKTALIIGKGPSLDKLSKNMIKSWQVCFFVNDSTKKANELGIEGFSVQQDGNLKDTCIMSKGIHFLSYFARGWNPAATIYHPSELAIAPSSPTVIAAIRLAKFMGIIEFELYAFDALKTNKITDYASIIGYSSTAKNKKPAERFFKQKQMVEKELKEFKWGFI